MLKHERKKQWVGPLLLVSFFAAILASVLFLDSHPEFERIVAADGGLTVEGELPGDLDVRVLRDEDASNQDWTAVVSDVYVVEPDDVLLPTAVAMQMPIGDADDVAHSIGFFDTDRNVWVPLDTRKDTERGIFEADTTHFSHWALLASPTVDVFDLDRATLFSDIAHSMPPGTNGYRVDLAYATVDGDFVLLEESADRRICSEPVTVRDRTMQTSTDRAVSLRMDGVERSGNLRAIVSWEIGSGCSTLIDPQDELTTVLD